MSNAQRIRPVMVDHETGTIFYMAPDGDPRELVIGLGGNLTWILTQYTAPANGSQLGARGCPADEHGPADPEF